MNDGYEILKLPGYYVTLFNVGNIGIGLDDIIQTIVGGVVAISPALREIGFGIIAGTWITKFGEQAGYKIQIIPHTALPPGSAFVYSPSNSGENKFSGYAGDRENTGNYNSMRASRQTSSAGSFADENEIDTSQTELTLSDTMMGEDFSVNTG